MSLPDQVITPGPCPPQGCPPPTEIDCIEVAKVFDLCFQEEVRTRTFTVTDRDILDCLCPNPEMLDTVCPIGAVLTCDLGEATCDEVSRMPTSAGFARIVLRISVPIQLIGPSGVVCTTQTVVFNKTVTLCAPEGTDVVCRLSGSCDCMIIDRTLVSDPIITSLTIECTLTLCVIVKTIADVNLLVPSYGFCTPAECVTMGLACPPPLPVGCEMPVT